MIPGGPEFQYAETHDVGKIVALDRTAFNEYDLIPEAIFKSWIEKNRRVFRVLKPSPDLVAGYYSLLPLKKAVLRKFIDGVLHEKSIRPEDLYTENDRTPFDSLYFFSIVLDKDRRLFRGRCWRMRLGK